MITTAYIKQFTVTIKCVFPEPYKSSWLYIRNSIYKYNSIIKTITIVTHGNRNILWRLFTPLIWTTLFATCSVTYTCHQIPKWKKFGHFEVFDDNNFCIFSATHMDTFRYEIYFGWLEGGRGNTWCHYSGGMSECE